jgi:hypothetical protein
MRHLPIAQWAVLIPDHHPGFIDWATFQANQARLDSNTRPKPVRSKNQDHRGDSTIGSRHAEREVGGAPG